ncbi:hypothetical protein HPB52_024502 [Rhipicephalus sanguineus]|uniref:Nlr family card domain protein n=1 Tax=Rhipicephalus sanguineus TaxID=34632 RepID=A0A9D4TC72_RHISA|nr:hypothetical protein HPB52_024502 [Rhipicephalus sanguineus]
MFQPAEAWQPQFDPPLPPFRTYNLESWFEEFAAALELNGIWLQAFMFEVGLELRELSPGQLSLVEVEDAFVPLDLAQRKHEAATLLCHLLMYHRCLVSVTRLQELECRLLDLERPLCEGLSKFLANARSLTTFKLSAQSLKSEDGALILEGLRRNAAITTLSLNTIIVSAFLYPSSDAFTGYLSENRTVRTLIVKSYYPPNQADMRLVLRSLFRTAAIFELELVHLTLNEANSRLVAELIGENQSLRVLRMVDCALYEDGMPSPSRISPWLAALGTNGTLEKLTMDLRCFSLNECRSLFEALKSNASLKNITAERIRPEDEAQICRALRETGVRERFLLGRHHVVREPTVTLTECEELSQIKIDSSALCRPVWLRTALSLLPSGSHVTSLSLAVWRPSFNQDVCALIAQYIAATKVLRELRWILASITSRPADRVERVLMRALCVNNSIRKLFMTGLRFDETEVQMLVDKLQASRALCELAFYPDDYNSTIWLVQKLSPIVSSNYTLIDVKVYRHVVLRADLFSVDDVVRRNASLVSRAAHFVSGMAGTRLRYCAEAVELVHWNPGVVAKVQALASVDENEAVSRIEQSFKSFSNLDGFMCAAGVVKYRVICHVRDDGQKQLVDIDGDCWWHIRRFLNMCDIKD